MVLIQTFTIQENFIQMFPSNRIDALEELFKRKYFIRV